MKACIYYVMFQSHLWLFGIKWSNSQLLSIVRLFQSPPYKTFHEPNWKCQQATLSAFHRSDSMGGDRGGAMTGKWKYGLFSIHHQQPRRPPVPQSSEKRGCFFHPQVHSSLLKWVKTQKCFLKSTIPFISIQFKQLYPNSVVWNIYITRTLK